MIVAQAGSAARADDPHEHVVGCLRPRRRGFGCLDRPTARRFDSTPLLVVQQVQVSDDVVEEVPAGVAEGFGVDAERTGLGVVNAGAVAVSAVTLTTSRAAAGSFCAALATLRVNLLSVTTAAAGRVPVPSSVGPTSWVISTTRGSKFSGRRARFRTRQRRCLINRSSEEFRKGARNRLGNSSRRKRDWFDKLKTEK
ncbi:hypothetical protein [Stieleria mannarensis]|uniref:hypothetical protein n=1 Tax=Stieleria mannarensis TaxID=2755585 RepID=UPI001C7281A9|nr:hypothetical protein [Rhodopirellula sp. JC639]